MNTKIFRTAIPQVALLAVLLSACASATATSADPTLPVVNIQTLAAIATQTAASVSLTTPAQQSATPAAMDATAVPAQTSVPASTNFCADPQVTALIDSLKKAVTTNDGELLASLVSPANGMDVAFYRNGTVINYDQGHAKFLFETTYRADWGAQPASGEEKIGSFHDVVVPELVKSFNQPYTLHCNELKYGGASYPVTFPYKKDYYSIYYPGTDANGNLDWHTWVVGMEYVSGKPYVYALTQFFWEP